MDPGAMGCDTARPEEPDAASSHLLPGCYYGEKIGDRAVAGLRLSECQYARRQIVEDHAHEHAYISFVLRGAYAETAERQDSVCFPSHVILHPAGERHSDRISDQGAGVFNLEIDRDWPARTGAPILPPAQRWEGQGGVSYRLMRHLYEEFRRPDEVSPVAVEALARELMAALSRQAPPTERRAPRRLEQAREMLESRFAEPLTLADIALASDVHPTYLARLFRRHYRCSVGEYVRECRVRFASRLLTQPELSLAEIAQMAGFADQSHFTRLFKCHYGVTPALYRLSLTKGCIRSIRTGDHALG